MTIVGQLIRRVRQLQVRYVFRHARYDRHTVRFGSELDKRFVVIAGGNLSIGEHTSIAGDCFINATGGVAIGRYCHIAKGLTVYSHNHNWRSTVAVPYDGEVVPGPVTIEDAVWLGANVTIAPGVRIGRGAIVSMGAVVFGEVPACAIVRGNPAEVIGRRDEGLFRELFEAGKLF